MSVVSVISMMAMKGGPGTAGGTPVAPASLTVIFMDFQAQLSWPAGTADLYEVQRGLASDYSDAVTIFTGTSLVTTDFPVKLGKPYYYRIRSIIASSQSGWVNQTLDTRVSDGTTGVGVYFFGDSITAGVGASDSAHRWTTLITAAKSWTENNFGHSGYTITPNFCRPNWDQAEIPNKTNSLKWMFIAFGVNDAFMNPTINPTTYGSYIQSAISSAISKGWNALRIIILSPFYTTFDGNSVNYCGSDLSDEARKQLFVDSAKSVADDNGCPFMDMFNYMRTNGGSGWLADQIHPNDAGHSGISSLIDGYIAD